MAGGGGGSLDLDVGRGTVDLTGRDKRRARRRAEAPSMQALDGQGELRVDLMERDGLAHHDGGQQRRLQRSQP